MLNHDHGYVGARDRWDWIDGAREAIRLATTRGWHVFVVTNQSGVARGYFTEAAVQDLLGWVADETRRAGGTIDDLRYCPYHPDAPLAAYRQASDWRKPGPGMLRDLIRAWELDPARCVMVGDQPSDLAAAAAAGMRGVRFTGGNLARCVGPLLGAGAEEGQGALPLDPRQGHSPWNPSVGSEREGVACRAGRRRWGRRTGRALSAGPTAAAPPGTPPPPARNPRGVQGTSPLAGGPGGQRPPGLASLRPLAPPGPAG